MAAGSLRDFTRGFDCTCGRRLRQTKSLGSLQEARPREEKWRLERGCESAPGGGGLSRGASAAGMWRGGNRWELRELEEEQG